MEARLTRVTLLLAGDERMVIRLLRALLKRLLRDGGVRCSSITATTVDDG